MKNGVLITVFLVVVVVSAIFYSAAPVVFKSGIWTHTVLRNWQDHGLRALGGKLVYNPGGIEPGEQPVSYGGHRPYPLYMPYAVGRIFGGAGNEGMAVYLLLSLMAAVSIWHLLGKDQTALLMAVATVLSAGFMRTLLFYDPLTLPAVLGLPVLVWVLKWFEAETVSWKTGIAAAGLLMLFAMLNWTTIFVLGIAGAYLLAQMPRQPVRWVSFGLVSLIGIGFVGIVSVADKQAPGGQAGFGQIYNTYLFGPGGYGGYPMNWTRAIMRLAVANFVGLFPMFCLYLWCYIGLLRREKHMIWRPLFPLGVAVVAIAGMRNYFAHHPWMAAPVIILGVIFSMRLMRVPPFGTTPVSQASPGVPLSRFAFAGIFLASVIYSYAVVVMLRVNTMDEDMVIKLVQAHTLRHDKIVIRSDIDPWLVQNTKRFGEGFDRKIQVISAAETQPREGQGGRRFLLTTAVQPGASSLVARNERENSLALKPALKALDWYRANIAKRVKGERFEGDRDFYLYKLQ